MTSSVHSNNKTKNILVLCKGITQGLDNTTIYAEKLYSINFTKSNARFCSSLHYNGENGYLFVNGTEIHKFKAKEYEIKDSESKICQENVSTNFSVNDMKKTGLYGCVYDFSVDFNLLQAMIY